MCCLCNISELFSGILAGEFNTRIHQNKSKCEYLARREQLPVPKKVLPKFLKILCAIMCFTMTLWNMIFCCCMKHAHLLGLSSSSRLIDVPAHQDKDSVFDGQKAPSFRVLDNALENNQPVSDMPKTQTQVAKNS